MDHLAMNPVLGHITTFGGHPVSCAAGLAAFKVLLAKNVVSEVTKKESLFRKLLEVPGIKSMRTAGLLIAIQFESEAITKNIIDYCIANGVLTDWFLFAPDCLRIAPPLTISLIEIETACKVVRSAIALYTR
jgi:acetylornithine/succinyldiaminopimelate/putrescine aminotransferase